MLSLVRVRLVVLFCCGLAIANCSVVNTKNSQLNEELLPENTSHSVLKCRSSAGVYTLSKTVLTASITFAGKSEKALGPTFNGLGIAAVGDPDHRYCLDYDGSPTAEETVRITKNDNGLLLAATGNIKDQSRYILESIIEAIFIGISGAPDFSVRHQSAADGETEIKFIYEFDPFDFEDTARFNERANDFGFCVVLPHLSFNQNKHTVDQYCNNPLRTTRRHAPEWHKSVKRGDIKYLRQDRNRPVFHQVIEQKLLRGLLYRPRYPYPVYLMNKVEGRWIIKARRRVLMENISPILSVGLERRMFARRTTALRFRDGVLEGACVYNSAGITEFINVPIAIARSLVRLPAEVIKVDIGETKANTQLANVEKRILLAQQRQLALLAQADQTTANTSDRAVTLGATDRLDAAAISAEVATGPSPFTDSDADFVDENGAIDPAKCPVPETPTDGAIATSNIPGIAPPADPNPPQRKPHVSPIWRTTQ